MRTQTKKYTRRITITERGLPVQQLRADIEGDPIALEWRPRLYSRSAKTWPDGSQTYGPWKRVYCLKGDLICRVPAETALDLVLGRGLSALR